MIESEEWNYVNKMIKTIKNYLYHKEKKRINK